MRWVRHSGASAAAAAAAAGDRGGGKPVAGRLCSARRVLLWRHRLRLRGSLVMQLAFRPDCLHTGQ